MTPHLEWFNQLTDGPWWVDLSALTGIVAILGAFFRIVVWPGLKSIWRFIVAAPRLAEGVGRLVELLETDLLHRVELIELDSKKTTDQIKLLEVTLSALKARLDAHDVRQDAHEEGARARDERIKLLDERMTLYESTRST